MAISQAAGSPFNNYGTSLATLAVTPVTVGDYLLFGAKASSDSVTITGVSGGGVTTWTQLVVANDTTNNGHEEIWGGVVTATGSQTITATYGSVPGVSCDLWASELVWSGGVGTWSLATSGLLVNLSTTISWPSLTSGTGANQAYWGINRSAQSTSPGSTSGFSYTTNANDNLQCFNGTLSASTAYQPTASQSPSGAAFNTAVFMSVASGYTGTATASGSVSVAGTAAGHITNPATALSLLGIYSGAADTADVAAVSASLGAQIPYVMDFLDGTSWASIEDSYNLSGTWSTSGAYTMIWGVDMLPNSGATLTTGATGAYNSYFTALAHNMVAAGWTASNCIIRMGWEFNGGWFVWAANGYASQFISYWQQIVTAMRAVIPGLRFFWNPTRGDQGIGDLATYYPGDAYVDYIGLDVYETEWGTTAVTEPAEWNNMLTQTYGLEWLVSFAATHGKPVCLGEWGLWPLGTIGIAMSQGGGDDPYFISQMAAWISANCAGGFACVWDYGGVSAGVQVPQGTDAPLSDAQFYTSFGAGIVLGAGTGSVSVTGSAAGKLAIPASAAGSVSVAGTAAGAHPTVGVGTGTGTVSVSGTATGVVQVPATASGTVSVSGAAAGAYPGLYAGAAAGHVTVAGTALGYSSISPPPVYPPPSNVWAEAIFADELQIVTVGEVYAGINGPLLATINNITNGTVKIDQTNANRRTCSDILMAIDASTTYLVPGVNSGDLFPDGGELFLQKGLVYPDGTTQLQPLGRFLIETPKVTRAVNGAGSLVIDLSGTDRSGTVARSLFTQPYATDGVSTVDVAIMAILNMQVPQLTAFDFAASPLVPPVASYAVGDNPWTACQALAALDSKELFFDPSVNAVCILRDIPDATVAPIAATYNADLSSIITQNTRGLSNIDVPNVILAQSQGSGVAIPLQAMWFDNNPLSPTYYGPAGPPVPPAGSYPTTVSVITVSGITDLPTLQAMANTAGAAQQGRFETCDTYIRDDPARDASDVVTINDPVLNMEANFVLDSLVVQMGYSTAMEIVGRRVY